MAERFGFTSKIFNRNFISGDPALVPVILLTVLLLVFGGSLNHEFVFWDDDTNILFNPSYGSPSSFESLVGIWRAPYDFLYIPVTYSAWWLTIWVTRHGFNPSIFHACNLLFHLLCAILVYRLLVELHRVVVDADSPTSRRFSFPAFAGSVFFLIHPVQAEVVCWVSGFRDVLSTFFSLLPILLFMRFRQSQRLSAYVASFFLFVVALLSKPSAVSVLPMLWVLDFFVYRTPLKVTAKQTILFGVPSLVLILVNRAAQGSYGLSHSVEGVQRIFVALFSIGFYLFKLLIPTRLSPMYGIYADEVVRQPVVLVSVLALVALIAVIVLVQNPLRRQLGLGLLLFLSGILPVLGLLSFIGQNVSTVSDRYVYLAMIGPAFAWSLIFRALPYRYTLPLFIVSGMAYGIASRGQTHVWKNTESLFSRVIELTPDNFIAHNNLGYYFKEKGRAAPAIAHLQYALVLNPNDEKARGNLQTLITAHVSKNGQVKPSESQNLQMAETLFQRANHLAQGGDFEGAAQGYRAVLSINSKHVGALVNLGNIHAQKQEWEEAEQRFLAALEADAKSAAAHENLARLYRILGDQAGAERHLRRAQELKP